MIDDLQLIDELTNSDDAYESLYELTFNDSPEVRLRAFEGISEYAMIKKTLNRLIDATSDGDELVRFEVVQQLGAVEDYELEVKSVLIECLDDRSWLVRGEAALALSKYNDAAIKDKIEKNLFDCKNDEERVRYYVALLCFGDEESYRILMGRLESDSAGYREKCSIVNLLSHYSACITLEKFLLEIEKLLPHQKSRAVISSIEGALEKSKK